MNQVGTSPPLPTAAEAHYSIWRRLGIYIFMVVWAVGGLAFTDVYPARSVAFWQLTTVLFAIIAIVHVVRSESVGRTTLALKQLAHWGAFLAAMVLLHSDYVTDLVTGDPLGVVTMILLALAVFIDGVYVNWRFLCGRAGVGVRGGGGGLAGRLGAGHLPDRAGGDSTRRPLPDAALQRDARSRDLIVAMRIRVATVSGERCREYGRKEQEQHPPSYRGPKRLRQIDYDTAQWRHRRSRRNSGPSTRSRSRARRESAAPAPSAVRRSFRAHR